VIAGFENEGVFCVTSQDAIVTAADSDTVLAEDEGSPAAAETEAEASSLIQQTLAFLLLISPFFFWGTSMVSMKVWFTPFTFALAA
jgi:hypothetical protein